MNRLIGKTVLITGATSGIGEASARLFAQNGANLILTGRRKERLDEIGEELTNEFGIDVSLHNFDIRDYDACVEFVESLKRDVDILVNNADSP